MLVRAFIPGMKQASTRLAPGITVRSSSVLAASCETLEVYRLVGKAAIYRPRLQIFAKQN